MNVYFKTSNLLINTQNNSFSTHYTPSIFYKSNITKDIFEKNNKISQTKDINIVGTAYKDKIKIVFSDIDGTITPHDDIISDKTLKAVNLLQEYNIPIILTTARCYKDTLPIINQLSKKPDYTIVLQGGSIIDKNGKAIIENSITTESSYKLHHWYKNEFSKDKNSHLIMYFNDQPYSESCIQFPWKARSLIVHVKSFSDLLKQNMKLQKAILYKTDSQNSDYKLISQSFDTINQTELCILQTGKHFYEFQKQNVSKEKAIKYILDELDIKPNNTMVIGDSANDINMLNFIKQQNGLSVAMGNATDNVKQYANAITSDINQGGFSKAISSFMKN